MRPPLPITISCAALLTIMLCGCQREKLVSAPPVCPEPIHLSKDFTDPMSLPDWFVVPQKTTASLSPLPGALPECSPRPRVGSKAASQ